MIKITSTRELRAFLVNQLEAAANGTLDYTRAKGITNIAQQVYNTLNIEIKVAAIKAKFGDDVAIKPVSFDA